MNSRFDDLSKAVIRLAGEISREMGYNYVGSEHILAAILKDGSSDTAAALENQSITYDKVSAKIVEYTTPDDGITENENLPFTPRSRTILELSYTEARRNGSSLIATEHIFLAILREGRSIAAKILSDLGFQINTLQGIC